MNGKVRLKKLHKREEKTLKIFSPLFLLKKSSFHFLRVYERYFPHIHELSMPTYQTLSSAAKTAAVQKN